jgi:hypothetical protein
MEWLESYEPPNKEQEDNKLDNPGLLQEPIGWRHFVRGRIPIQWGQMINDHQEKYHTHTMTAEQWGSRLLSIDWEYVLKLCEGRNNIEDRADQKEC